MTVGISSATNATTDAKTAFTNDNPIRSPDIPITTPISVNVESVTDAEFLDISISFIHLNLGNAKLNLNAKTLENNE